MTTPSQVPPFLELDRTISDAGREWQRRAREFARDVVAPTGVLLDRMDAADVVADGSPFWDFLAQAHREGFTKLSGPPELGGLGLSRLEEFLAMEEITTGDAGLSAVLFLAPFSAAFAYQLGSPELVEEISRPYFSGADPRLHSCWAITEMGHGSDMLTGHTPSLVSDARGDCVAHRDGDGWVVDGAKSTWVSCGATATHVTLYCGIDGEPLDRGLLAVLPTNLPGISQGPAIDKHGLRALNQGQVVFDDVRLPAHYVLMGPDDFNIAVHSVHTLANVAVAMLAIGTGRAAYEGALKWTGERIAGGRALADHQLTKNRLFRMFMALEAGRALSRAVYTYNYGEGDEGRLGSLQHSVAAKVFVTDASMALCEEALQLCGARGTLREGVEFADGSRFHPEKLMRDAKSYRIADGENTFLELIGGSHIVAEMQAAQTAGEVPAAV
jgi:alkylation response protein AidB-like acyl-CoA dehydrogenase